MSEEDVPDSPETETTRYGEEVYWDDRYGNWAPDPYDWLFEWRDISAIVESMVPKTDRVLLPGCGNAPLSPDMYDAGYRNQLNFDTSDVVIQQMRELHADKKGMQYELMDATALDLDDQSFDAIIDKSLIDTLRCCSGSSKMCKMFVDEMYRVLKPAGICIALSLNEYSKADIDRYYNCPEYDWEVAWIHLPNPNYEPAKENTETYTYIVCKKTRSDVPLQAQLEEWEKASHREGRLKYLADHTDDEQYA